MEKIKQVKVVGYDPEWPKIFAAEANKIQKALGTDALVEHVGSTSVPGLAAKPKIDIVVAVKNPAKENDFLVLYHGVDIVAYAHLKFIPGQKAQVVQMLFDQALDKGKIKKEFLQLLEQWIGTVNFE